MKNTELIVGDFVFVKSKHKVGVVHEIYSKSVHVWCGEKYGSIYSDRYGYDDIEPIPLTSAILERNGFHYVPSSTPYYYNNTMDVLVIKYQGDYRYFTGILSHRVDVNYVHELQNALFLCGLEDFASNFKIDNFKQEWL